MAMSVCPGSVRTQWVNEITRATGHTGKTPGETLQIGNGRNLLPVEGDAARNHGSKKNREGKGADHPVTLTSQAADARA